MSSATGLYRDCTVEIAIGHRAVLPHLEGLIEAAKPWGQSDEALDLRYFISKPARHRTRPCMVLLRGKVSVGEPPSSVLGAVLLCSFAGTPGSLRLFLSSNRRGRRTVFAPAAARVEVAALAAQKLMEQGARFVNIDFDLGPCDADLQTLSPSWPRHLGLARLRLRSGLGTRFEWSLHEGRKRFDLALHQSYDQTVAALGKRSRRNLRYYQRLCVRDLGASFVPAAEITRQEFLAMNPACTYPVAGALAEWRFNSLTRFSNTFVAGLRDAQGAWLSLLGGRRNHGAIEIDWQMNRRGYERYSLTTAMRSFLIEHEGGAGSVSLYLEGGTVHSMRDSFRFHVVYNLAARRPSTFLRALTWFLERFLPDKTVTQAISRPWRIWSASDALSLPSASPPHPE